MVINDDTSVCKIKYTF